MPKFVFAIFIILVIAGCYYDSEEYLFPQINNLCDTTSVTYSSSVQPVLEQYCYRCHSNANAPSAGNNIKLEDYSDVVISANNLSLYGSIAHESGFSPMPKGGGKLDDCTIDIMRIWIDTGAPNN